MRRLEMTWQYVGRAQTRMARLVVLSPAQPSIQRNFPILSPRSYHAAICILELTRSVSALSELRFTLTGPGIGEPVVAEMIFVHCLALDTLSSRSPGSKTPCARMLPTLYVISHFSLCFTFCAPPGSPPYSASGKSPAHWGLIQFAPDFDLNEGIDNLTHFG